TLICSCARLILIFHQVYGPIEYVEPPYLVMSSLIREAFKGYGLSFILILAIDRWIATVSWSWYESRNASTIIAFLLLEVAQLLISWTLAALLITEVITDQQITLIYAILLIIAVSCFIAVLRYNRREIEVLK
ncbi:hypothetical protein PMAYCL1PPCAC_27631, partial [Pristionchus mayeri]